MSSSVFEWSWIKVVMVGLAIGLPMLAGIAIILSRAARSNRPAAVEPRPSAGLLAVGLACLGVLLLAMLFGWVRTPAPFGPPPPIVVAPPSAWPTPSDQALSAPSLAAPRTVLPSSLTVDPTRSLFQVAEPQSVPVPVYATRLPAWLLVGALMLVGALLAAPRLWKWARQHAGAAIPLAAVLGVFGILGLTAVTTWSMHGRQVAEQRAVFGRPLHNAIVVQDSAPMTQSRQQAQRPADWRSPALRAMAASRVQEQSAAQTPASQVLDYRGDQPAVAPLSSSGPDSQGAALHSQARDASSDGEIVAFLGTESVGQRLEGLPGWVTEPPSGDAAGDRRYVVSSKQWATVEEAERELSEQLAADVRKHVAREQGRAGGWTPSFALLRQSGTITRRCHETTSLQVGEFTEPMYRVYWQVQSTPAVRDFFLASWRSRAQEQRLVQAGIGFGLLTLLFGSAAGYYRLDNATGGRYRGRLRLAAAAIAVAGGVATALLA